MKDEFHLKNKMIQRVEAHLRATENESLWLDQPPRLTELVESWETKTTALGILGTEQEANLSGYSEEQNAADRARKRRLPTGEKITPVPKGQGNLAKAGEWTLSATKWQRMREDALLGKAKALLAEITPLTTGTPAPGAHYGITAADVTAFSPLVSAYESEIANPGTAKGGRKARTDSLRPAYHAADEDLYDIDDFIEALRDKSEAHRHFVETYFNIRHIGGGGSDGGAGMNKGPASPPPPPVSLARRKLRSILVRPPQPLRTI